MAKPVLLTVDDDPEVLRAVERDLRRRYAEHYRELVNGSGTHPVARFGRQIADYDITTLYPLAAELRNFSKRADRDAVFSLEAVSELGERLSGKGSFRLDPMSSRGEIAAVVPVP